MHYPIDMVLYCPACGMQHIDEPEALPLNEWPYLTKEGAPSRATWTNPPHRSHLCKGCGHIWRPADIPTNGVAAIKTKGADDHPPPVRQPPVTLADVLDEPVEHKKEPLTASKFLKDMIEKAAPVEPITYTDVVFEKTTVEVGTDIYIRCIFNQCLIAWDGQGGSMQGCRVVNCRHVFIGAACNTLNLLSLLYRQDPWNGEATFQNIRLGTYIIPPQPPKEGGVSNG